MDNTNEFTEEVNADESAKNEMETTNSSIEEVNEVEPKKKEIKKTSFSDLGLEKTF